MNKNKTLYIIAFFLSFSCQNAMAQYNNVANADYQNAEYLANENALSAIGADKAYSAGEDGTAYSGFSGKGVTVAVVDSGTDYNHVEFKNKNTDLQDPHFNIYQDAHGTHVSGIIGANNDDSTDGMHGVAFASDLLYFSTNLGYGESEEEEDDSGKVTPPSCPNCLETEAAWNALLNDKFKDVKIINNSWGAGTDPLDSYSFQIKEISQNLSLAKQLANKGKLIVAAAGNETNITPNALPAGLPYFDSALSNNIISVVAYDATKTPDSPEFIAEFSNLAFDAQRWSIAAPGVDINSASTETSGSFVPELPAPDSSDETPLPPAFYETKSGTSMAAPMVSGTAALVQEAFGFLNGKQIADVLFSTAFKKEDLTNLSPYMIQISEDGETKRGLFFTDNTVGMTFEQAEAILNAQGYQCGIDINCHEVTFQDVFGQGLLNAGDAIKGLKTLDANRLTIADYDTERKQFFYTIDTQGLDGTFSNDITQTKRQEIIPNEADISKESLLALNEQEYLDANVGLKKTGTGILTLTGTSSFSGETLIEDGELKLTSATGIMQGNALVNSGVFSVYDDATMNGALNIAANGKAYFSNGNANNTIKNNGTLSILGGSFSQSIENNNLVTLSGFDNEGTIESRTATFLNGLDNHKDLTISEGISVNGTINNYANTTIQGNIDSIADFQNNGFLTGVGKFSGTVNNTSTGSITTSVDVENLTSSGKIILTKDNNTGLNDIMIVDNLNITGGNFAIQKGQNFKFMTGNSYQVIQFTNKTAFSNFANKVNFSDFVVGNTKENTNSIDVDIEFLRISEQSLTQKYDNNEKIVASFIDKMMIDENNPEFTSFYMLSTDELQSKINQIRNKAKPVENEQLPLTKTMSSQVYSHLFNVQMNRNASTTNRQYQPNYQYNSPYSSGRSGGSETTKNKLWTQALFSSVSQDAAEQLKDETITTNAIGAMFGYDYQATENWLIGLTGGFSHAKLSQEQDDINVKDLRVGLYSGYRLGQFTLNSMIMAGLQDYKTARSMEISGQIENAQAKFEGKSAEIDINLGYDFMRLPYRDYSFYMRSYLGVNANYIEQDAYKETGTSSLLLSVSETDDTSVSVQPGVTLGYTFTQAVLTFDASYQRLLSGGAVKSSAYFLADDAKQAFDSISADTDKDYFNLGIGLKSHISNNMFVNFFVGTRLSKNTKALNAAASLAYEF